jgi:hypothetical protein
MIRRLKRKLLLGVAVVTVLACATAAVVMAAQPSAKAHTKGHHGTRHGGPLMSAAGYLGLTTAQLRSDLQSGKSLGEIANATAGKSEAGLIQALEAADRQKLAAISARLPRRVAAEVARVGGPPARRANGAQRRGLRAHALHRQARRR